MRGRPEQVQPQQMQSEGQPRLTARLRREAQTRDPEGPLSIPPEASAISTRCAAISCCPRYFCSPSFRESLVPPRESARPGPACLRESFGEVAKSLSGRTQRITKVRTPVCRHLDPVPTRRPWRNSGSTASRGREHFENAASRQERTMVGREATIEQGTAQRARARFWVRGFLLRSCAGRENKKKRDQHAPIPLVWDNPAWN